MNATASALFQDLPPRELAVRGVSKSFGAVRALIDVDLVVSPGEVHGLIGPNGSGKTTLFNVVCGQEKPTGGTVLVDGRSTAGASPERIARRGIARTFQIPRSFRELTVRENVLVATHMLGTVGILRGMFRVPRTGPQERELAGVVDDLLDFVGISHLRDQVAGTLSSGHTRLLEVARALATRSSIVLMDEPAAGLSQYEAEKLQGLIRELRSRGVSVLLVEHNVNFVMSLCDQVSVLYNGQLIASGKPADVRSDEQVIRAYLGGA